MRVEPIQKEVPVKQDRRKKIKGLDMEYCVACGKPIVFTAFMIRSNYRFCVTKNSKRNYYCSYSCMCSITKKIKN